MVNKVTLIGNLGRDPEIRHLENGGMVGKFPVATNESYKDKN
jgi:single-strand DNA-binding protein